MIHHFFKWIFGCAVYQPYVNIHHEYTISLNDIKGKPCILVRNGEIKNVYIYGHNYRAERYLKKYRENETLQKVIQELQKEG